MKTNQPVMGSALCSLLRNAIGSVLLIAWIAPTSLAETNSTSFQTRLSQIESKLSQIKIDVIHLYPYTEAGSGYQDSVSVRPSPRPSENHPSEGGDRKNAGSSQDDADPQKIALLMKNLEAATAQGKSHDPATDEIRLRLADHFLQSKMIPQAEPLLKDLAAQTRSESISTEAWFLLEELYYRRGDSQQALGAFLKIYGKHPLPRPQEAIYLAGNSYLHLKEYRKAIELLDEIDEKSDDYPFALYSSGLAHLNLGDTGVLTPKPFQKLMAINPRGDPVLRELVNRTHLTWGFYLIEKKQYEEAIPFFEAVPPESLYRIPARFGIGLAYLRMEECVKAIVVFNELIEQAPADPYALEAQLHVGTCYSRLNAYRKAVDRYQDALHAYSARKERLAKLAQSIQNTHPVSTGKNPAPVPLQPELAIERDYPELMEAFTDWFRLDEQISRIDQRVKGTEIPASGPDIKRIQVRMRDIRRDLDELLRSAMADQISNRMKQIGDLALRANMGMAKNLIFMQDYGLAP